MSNIFTKIGFSFLFVLIAGLVVYANLWAVEVVGLGVESNKMSLVVIGGMLLVGIPAAIGKVALDYRNYSLQNG